MSSYKPAAQKFTRLGMSLISEDLRQRALATIQWLKDGERVAGAEVPNKLQLANMVRIVASAGNFPLAMRFVETVEERSGEMASPQVYNALLDAVGSWESEPSLELLERFRRWGADPPPYFLQMALRRASKAGDCALTELLYEHWTELDYGVDGALSQLRMNAYAAARDPNGVGRVMREMSYRGVTIDDGHRVALVHAHARCGHTEAAEAVFSTIVAPGADAFTIMLHLYAQKRKVEMMLATVDRMKLAGVQPDALSLNPVLHLLLRGGYREATDAIVDFMRAHRVAPDRAARTLLMQYYATRGRSEEVKRLIDNPQFDPTNKTMVNAAIKALAEIRDYDAARAMLNSLGERADAYSYHSLLRSIARDGHAEEAFGLVERMWATSIRRDSRTYTMLFMACARQACPALETVKFTADRAMEMFERDTVQPDVFLLSAVLSACISESKPHYVKKVLSMVNRFPEHPKGRQRRFCCLAVELASITGNPRDLLRAVRGYEKLGLASDDALRTAVAKAVELGARLDHLSILQIVRRRRLEPGSELANGVLQRCIDSAMYKASNKSNDEVLT